MNVPRRLAPLLLLAFVTAAVVALVDRRPPLPELPASLETPVSTTFVQQLLLTAAWTALLIVLAFIATRAARAVRQPTRRPARTLHRRPRPTALVRRPPRGPMPLRVAPPPPPTPPGVGSLSLKLDLDIPAATAAIGPPPMSETSTGAEVDAAQPEQQPPVRIRLLGPFEIEGAPTPRRAATRELIAYLALHPNGATRDQLLEALWPNSDPKRSRPRLWQSTAEARRILGDAFARDDDGRYRLGRERVRIDTDELARQLAEGLATTPDEALALWRGDPLDGADYPWADSHLRQLRGTQIDLLVRAGTARLDAGDAHGALAAAERGIAIDQLHEGCWRLALRAEADLGLRDAVAARYERLVELLDDRLGLRPEPATTSLYRELLV